jgi:hypothetical protein
MGPGSAEVDDETHAFFTRLMDEGGATTGASRVNNRLQRTALRPPLNRSVERLFRARDCKRVPK